MKKNRLLQKGGIPVPKLCVAAFAEKIKNLQERVGKYERSRKSKG